jgi:pilus assembly protein FimV
MHSEETHRAAGASPVAEGPLTGRSGMSRRQALGRMSAVAGAGAAAWVVPEILTAKPAAGATLSGSGSSTTPGGGVSTSPGTTGTAGTSGTNGTNGTNGAAATDAVTAGATLSPSPTLAFTGLNIQRDAEIGAALIAGGWAMQHWASRTPKLAADGPTDAPEVGGASDLT